MMSDIIEETWQLPEVDTVFNLVFRMDPGAAPDGHEVAVTCLWPPLETRHVTLYASRPTPIAMEFKSGYRLRGEMDVVRSGGQRAMSIGVHADLSYDLQGQPLVQYFRGFIFLREIPLEPIPPPDPPPWIPPDPGEPGRGGDGPIIAAEPGELFPYVYIRHWPKIPEENLEYGFFGYAPASPPASSFIGDLGNAVPEGRTKMEKLALDFIDGAAPYQGQFIATRTSLAGPVRDFAQVALRLRRPEPWPEEWVDQLCFDVNVLLRRYGETGAYLDSTAYLTTIDQVWQSYFALVVMLGYDQALLADFGLTLWLANAIDKALAAGPAGDLHVEDGLTPGQRALLHQASVLLPADVFPLPPAAQWPGLLSPPGNGGWVEPYAVGDLQMVRQRLVRYSAGEIARIENVMRGERREVSSRQARQQLDVEQVRSDERQILESDDADERLSLLEEASRTVAGKTISDGYVGFTTSYGPPTQATVDGTRNRITTSQAPGGDDVTRFAREILSKTVNRMTRKVGTVRASSILSQVEDAVVSVIDNSAGGGNLCAVYRWVNKVYEACVVNYGNRLIMEFVVRLPAADLAARRATGPDRPPDVAVPPARLAIDSFEDVTPENYPQLCAAYGVTDISPPPAPRKLVTVALRAGDEAQVAIPPGYCASTARAGCVSTPPGPPPEILVGYQLVAPGGDAAALDSYGEDSTLPVSVADVAATLSPPVSPAVLVNVEIECARTPRRMAEWQIEIYGALVKAYRQDVERRRTVVVEGALPLSPLSPLAVREIVRRELKRGCTRLLLARGAAIAGGEDAAAQSPPVAEVDQPRTVQFLDEALEWPEMTYMFQHGHPDGDAGRADGDDALFAGFLDAAHARVLVPVRPERAIAFLYFYTAGMIWDGPDWLVAVNGEDVHVVDDLKRVGRDRAPERRVGPPWEVVVPTAMQILDDLDRGPRGADLALDTSLAGDSA